jgi:hypothetical protein
MEKFGTEIRYKYHGSATQQKTQHPFQKNHTHPTVTIIKSANLRQNSSTISSPRHHGYHGAPVARGGIINLRTAQLRGIVPPAHRIDHIVEDGAAQVLPPRAHSSHCGPLVGARVVAFHRVERTLAVRAADGVQVAVENGHRYAQPPGVHARHFGPFVLLWNRVVRTVLVA